MTNDCGAGAGAVGVAGALLAGDNVAGANDAPTVVQLAKGTGDAATIAKWKCSSSVAFNALCAMLATISEFSKNSCRNVAMVAKKSLRGTSSGQE